MNHAITETTIGAGLILASASPRRAEILRALRWRFAVRTADIDETPRTGESPSEYVERLARSKALAVEELIRVEAKTDGVRDAAGDDVMRTARFVLGADTTVVLDGDVLGKPRDADEARSMLARLRDRWHEVLTGVALVERDGGENQRLRVEHEVTRVRFAPMTDDEIGSYVQTGEPMDKAGAYGVQGRAAIFVERIEGDYWNVVGLPARRVYTMLRSLE